MQREIDDVCLYGRILFGLVLALRHSLLSEMDPDNQRNDPKTLSSELEELTKRDSRVVRRKRFF
ncbi:hypothetical protein CBM2613_U10045 [Cupriavidus taiwanensis]|uniref:Uncharacterized protein n=1 Tax=Cupriavidus taiwanensis TaxID=164546 RepID=A0A375EH85_9BURK|nr:hypothetical protein CBM2613_U10045 [Cupriavidus taiwanensis]